MRIHYLDINPNSLDKHKVQMAELNIDKKGRFNKYKDTIHIIKNKLIMLKDKQH